MTDVIPVQDGNGKSRTATSLICYYCHMMYNLYLRFPLIITVLGLALAGCQHKSEHADLVVHNAKIYSMNQMDETFEAMAIKDGRILELGAERQILNRYKADTVIDAQTMPIYPGFIDAHCHFLGYGMSLQNVNLVGTDSFNEVLVRTEAHAASYSGSWIEGRGWDQNDWEIQEYPDNSKLDSLFSERPVFLRRIDGHAAVANSLALEAAGITLETKVDGGEILVVDGKLTGVLIDNAVDLVTNVIPEMNQKMLTRALLEAQANCFKVGLTTCDDAGLDKDDVDLIQNLQASGDLKMRLYVMMSDDSVNFSHFMKTGPLKNDLLNVRSFKFYADGSLGSRGACLLSPYADMVHPQQTGFLLSEEGHFKQKAQQLYDAGFQMNTHCIGDSANRLMLNIYADVLGGTNDRRWRIEHAQVVHKMDIEKFAEFSIIPSIQPTHATSDMYWAEQRLGRNRVRRAYAYQELKNQLGMVALGTDFPVEGISPINTFYAAAVRKDHQDYPDGGYQMENALTRKEALKGMTIWAALANFEELEKGSLEPGKFGDFVILDRDILKVPVDQILETRVRATVIGGEVVHQ